MHSRRQGKRWYTVNDNYGLRNFSCVPAMDGLGLVCQDLWTSKSESRVTSLILVHNLLGNSARVLPFTPVDWPPKLADVKVKLAVDKDSRNFKIFYETFQWMGADSSCNPLLNVYDSTSNGWKSSSYPSGPFWSVVFQGFLHVLFCFENFERLEYQLWRYNHIEDVWEEVEVDMIFDGFMYPELVVSANRLFLVTWFGKNPPFWAFGLRQFIIPDMRSEAVFEIPEADMIPFLGVEFEYRGQCPKMNVFGFGNFLAIMSKSSGVLKVFDVVTRKMTGLKDQCWITSLKLTGAIHGLESM